MNGKMILNDLKVTGRYLGQSQMTSGDKLQIVFRYKGKTASMTYHDNYLNKGTTEDFIHALLLDADCYRSNETFEDFMLNFGYEEKEALRIYNACKKQSEKVDKLFTEEEQRQLTILFENY